MGDERAQLATAKELERHHEVVIERLEAQLETQALELKWVRISASSAEEEVVSLRGQLAGRVPFEVFKYRCDCRYAHDIKSNAYRCSNAPFATICCERTCPLIPKD